MELDSIKNAIKEDKQLLYRPRNTLYRICYTSKMKTEGLGWVDAVAYYSLIESTMYTRSLSDLHNFEIVEHDQVVETVTPGEFKPTGVNNE